MQKIITLLLLLYSTLVFTQNFEMTWQQCYGGSEDEKVRSIIPYNNGYLFFGHTASTDGDISSNNCDGAAWLVNIDSIGNIIFDKSYCGNGGATGTKLLQLENGDFYFVGSSGPNGPFVSGFWLSRIDPEFNIIRQSIYGGSYVEMPRGACIAHDGGVIENGITGSNDGDIEEYYGCYDNWLVKLNEDGSKGWIKTIANIGCEEAGAIIPTSDGGYMLLASGNSQMTPGNIYFDVDHGMFDAWLIKLNANGEIEWNKSYGGSYDDYFTDIIELDDGYIIVGSTLSSDGDLSGHHGNVDELFDIWVIRINLNGEIIWSSNFGGTNSDSANKVFKNDDNTYSVFGLTASYNGDVQGNNAPNNEYIIWMLKINENGELIYQKPFDELYQLSDFPDFICISDYKYIAAVTKRFFGCNYTWNNRNDDIYVFEIQDMDEFIPSHPFGNNRVCLGLETESHYTTNLVVDTMETQWQLKPEEAGSITAMQDSVLINWDIAFNDTAWLKVKSINQYGESSYSPAKEIIVYQPINVSGIIGPDTICTVVNEQTTFTTSNTESLNLNWHINPTEAGTIITQEDTAIIMWDSIYEGEVELKTSTINNCGDTAYSPVKEIQIKTCLATNETNYSRLKVYPNPAKEYMIFNLPQHVKQNQIRITDIYGRNIKTIPINENQQQIKWDCRNVKSGVYFYQIDIQKKLYKGKILIE